MGKIVKLSSGAELDITMVSFDEGELLLDACLREIGQIDINSKTDHVALFKNAFARLKLSKEVKSCLKPCLACATYTLNGVVTKLTDNHIFEDEKVRGDYLPVLKEVLEYNLSPFFASLISSLKDLESQIRALQKPL